MTSLRRIVLARSRVALFAICVVAELANAAVTFAQQAVALPPIRQLGRRVAISTDSLANVAGIRQLSDGRVIVNDNGKRRLLMFDSTLSHSVVIADSTSSTKKMYGAAPGGILRYRGDTTIFVDPVALSMLVIDPRGVIVRTVAPPRPSDALALTISLGNAVMDANGRVVYRSVAGQCLPSGQCMYSYHMPVPDTTSKTLPSYAMHDSVAIIRGDIATHVIDTVGFIAVPALGSNKFANNPDGSVTITTTMSSPIPIADDWTVVADGTVAFVRDLDYHIDWVNPDGTRGSTPRIAHDWHRLSDSEKTVILDSAKRYMDSTDQVRTAQQTKTDSINKAQGRPRRPQQTYVYVWPDVSDIPDYRPVIAQAYGGFVKADADNNLWIPQGGSNYLLPGSGAAPVYDIVNREGRLIDRVQLPPSLSIAGFGPGVIYLTSREGSGTVLVKYRIH
jgi:hypothetical protein